MISVKILGTGCKKCQTLEQKVRDVVPTNNVEATVEKVTDINEMRKYGYELVCALKGFVYKIFLIIPKMKNYEKIEWYFSLKEFLENSDAVLTVLVSQRY